MKILYGICGEGMGHATRSQVALQHLRSRGHEVLVAASDQALRVLRSGSSSRAAAEEIPPSAAAALGGRSETSNERGRVRPERVARERGASLPPADETGASLAASPRPYTGRSLPYTGHSLLPITGMGMRCSDGGMDLRGTIEENAQRLPAMLRDNAAAWTAAERFQPDAVITDYDSFGWFFGAAHRLPIVSIDNAQVLPRCIHREDAFGPYRDGMRALETFTIAKAPSAQHYIVTSFFYPPVKPHLRSSTTLVPPILRGEVLRALATPRATENHVLVYKTGSLDDASVLGPLARVPEQQFLVYGLRGGAAVPSNVVAKPFDTTAFLSDLAAARAVIGNAGMSLLGEALAFGKPLYVVPMRGQFEQVLNACYVEQLGYGTTSPALEPDRLRAFLANAPAHAAAIARVPQHDRNERLYATLDALFPSRGRE